MYKDGGILMQIFLLKKINIWFIAPIRRQGLFLSNELSFAIITEAMRMMLKEGLKKRCPPLPGALPSTLFIYIYERVSS